MTKEIKHIKVTEYEYRHDKDLNTRTLTINGKVFALVGRIYTTAAMKVGLDDMFRPLKTSFGLEEPEISGIQAYDLYFAMDKNGKKIKNPKNLATDGEWVAEIKEENVGLTASDLEQAMMDGARHYLKHHYHEEHAEDGEVPTYEDKDLANELTDAVCGLLFGDEVSQCLYDKIYTRVLKRLEELGDGDK